MTTLAWQMHAGFNDFIHLPSERPSVVRTCPKSIAMVDTRLPRSLGVCLSL